MSTLTPHERLREADFTQVFTTDLNGRTMGLQINPERIESFQKRGIGFDGSSIAGLGTVDDSDRLLVPIMESLQTINLEQGTLGFLIGRINSERGERSASDPRAVLEHVLEKAEREFGARFLAGPEHEFFLLTGEEFKKGIHTDSAGYFHASRDRGEDVRKRIVEVLYDCGIQYEKTHHEVTASQHEINLECDAPLNSADRTILIRYVTQKVAEEFGFHASFMPKPFDGQNRNAFHIHLSMQDLEGNNLFYDDEDEEHLSQTAKHFIGGILKYARETSIIMASTVNSYKAYVLGKEAPIVRGWGLKNRSSMVRVPYAGSPRATRVELRNPDPSGNVYLQFAAMIYMGLRGIEEELPCGEPDEGSMYEGDTEGKLWDERFLPRCMFEALVEAERSQVMRDFLGDDIYDAYMTLKRRTWEEHRTHVTSLEHQRYLSL